MEGLPFGLKLGVCISTSFLVCPKQFENTTDKRNNTITIRCAGLLLKSASRDHRRHPWGSTFLVAADSNAPRIPPRRPWSQDGARRPQDGPKMVHLDPSWPGLGPVLGYLSTSLKNEGLEARKPAFKKYAPRCNGSATFPKSRAPIAIKQAFLLGD